MRSRQQVLHPGAGAGEGRRHRPAPGRRRSPGVLGHREALLAAVREVQDDRRLYDLVAPSQRPAVEGSNVAEDPAPAASTDEG